MSPALKRALKWSFAISALVSMIAFVQIYHVPKLKRWILFELQSFSQAALPIHLEAEDVGFRFWPPGIEFQNLKAEPQDELAETLSPFQVERARAVVSPVGLLKGQLRVGRVLLQDSQIKLKIKAAKGPASSPPKIDWSYLIRIPVDQVALSRVNVQFESEIGQFHGSIKRLAVRLQNLGTSLRIRILADELVMTKDKETIDLDVITEFSADQEGISVQGLRLKRDSSFVFGSGRLSGDLSRLRLENFDGRVLARLNLSEATLLLRDILGQQKVPQMKGTAFLTSDLEFEFKRQLLTAKGRLEGTDVAVNQFNIGNTVLEASAKNKEIKIEALKVENPGGKLEFRNTQVQTESPFRFQTEAIGDAIHIQRLLDSLGIKNVPVETRFGFKIPCSGTVAPKPQVSCQGQITNAWAKVATKGPSPIVEFENANATGSFTVDDKNVSYKAQLKIGESVGKTEGIVEYEKGFKINYESESVRFTDFKSLVGLNLVGTSKLKGSTQGDSSQATFQMDLHATDFWFDDYGLGNVSTQMSYRKGNIYFMDMKGIKNQTQYQGQVRFDIEKDFLDISGRAPFVSLDDIQEMTARRVPLPVKLSGTGSATFQIQGPPELNKLSSAVNASFFRGDISGESFDQLHFAIRSLDGNLTTEKIQLIKGGSVANLSGTLSSKGEMRGYGTAKNFFVDQSEFLKSLGLNVAGTLSLEAEFGGYFLDPVIKSKGTISNMFVADRSAQNSTFDFTVTAKEIEGKATLIGESIRANYQWPLNDTGAYLLDVQAVDWNFAQFFNIANDTPRPITHNTSLTGRLRLEGPQVALAKTSGFLAIEKIFVENAGSRVENADPLRVEVRNGSITNQSLQVSGGDNYFKVLTQNSRLDSLDLKIDGRLDLLLVSILTPFLDDLRGSVALNLAISGPLSSPDLLGSLYIQDGYLRIRNFPHAFEQIRADLLFSQKKLLVNSVRGRLAGGIISGGGQIEFLARDRIPIDIRGSFQDCVFNVPASLTTRGSGEYYLHGDYPPYTLGGIFSVYSGSLDQKINANEETAIEIRPSPYLPKFLTEKQLSPIHLDLEAIMQNPLAVTIEMPQVVIKTAVDGRIAIRGPPEATLLTGRLTLAPQSTVTVRNNVFNITNGTVDYRGAPPENPEINVGAEARIDLIVNENIEREYDVYGRFTGPAQKLNIQMTSQPPLAERELISLVTLGYINESDNTVEGSNTSAQASTTGYQIGSQFLDEQLGINRRLEKTLGVNFRYSSSFDASEQAARHTFVLKKQWSPRFGTSASRSVGKSDTNNVKAEYKLNRNMSLIGSWEGKEQTGASATDNQDGETNIFGLDIEFKREFK